MTDIKAFLEAKYDLYNRPAFIENDPVQVPHLFSKREDIEISGFLTAILSWGQRKTIISKSLGLMRLMHNNPHAFIMSAPPEEMEALAHFCHRTFNGQDAMFFLHSLKNLYTQFGNLENVFAEGFGTSGDINRALPFFRQRFLEIPHPERVRKHIADITRGSSGKRLNMFLRWMVRTDNRGVDFGLWKKISPAWLHIPLDLHTGRTARYMGLLDRKQNDWQAVCALTRALCAFDPNDPVRYDFALFGAGVHEGFGKNN
jgi:uncharacterized protein (TIGR02757 family)